MRKLAIGMRPKHTAFTLIEILVVVSIIGITIGFALLSFGDFGASRQAKISAEQFSAYLRLMQHKAILEDRTLALAITNHGYTPLALQSNESWGPVKGNIVFKAQRIPPNISIHYGPLQQGHKPNGMLLIHPSGDTDAFTLYFGTQSASHLIRVSGSHDGKVRIDE